MKQPVVINAAWYDSVRHAVVAKPRQVDVLVSQGRTTTDAIRPIGVTAATSYRLRKAVADLTRDTLILKDAASGHD